jgi:hypothetical protein
MKKEIFVRLSFRQLVQAAPKPLLGVFLSRICHLIFALYHLTFRPG